MRADIYGCICLFIHGYDYAIQQIIVYKDLWQRCGEEWWNAQPKKKKQKKKRKNKGEKERM